MNKMRFETPDLALGNIDKIAALFPNVITETKEKNGSLKRGINFELLKQMLAEDVVEGKEAYEFTWVGKKSAIREAHKPIRKTLRPCREESVDWDTTRNLYIEGDNLEVLKLLQESYLGKVKMIYIDPPYNTGNDFIYEDDFKMSIEEYAEETGEFDDEGNRLFKNTDTNGRFHSDWCSMMYSRLLVSRNLLSDDGAIFISIADHEQANLKKICDEVYGARNMVAVIPWQSRASIQNDTDFSVNHEYILVYAKKRRLENTRLKESNASQWYVRDSFVCRPLPLDKDKFDNPDGDPRGLWKADPFDAPGVRENLTYAIVNPKTGESHYPPSGRHWRTEQKNYYAALEDGRIVFGKNGDGRPQQKSFYKENKEYGSIDNSWFSAERVGTSTNGTALVKKMFEDARVFDSPKPVTLLRKLLYLSNVNEDSIVLDFFSGSATTAHAVMEMSAEEKVNCHFILVQIPEACDEKSVAFKKGYDNICELGKARIRIASSKIKAEHPDWQGDTGFRVLKIDSTNMKDVYYSADEYSQADLSDWATNIKEDRSDMDLLFQCLLEWGLPLSLPHSSEQVGGCTIHNYNNGDLIACFEKDVPEEVIRAIADKKPLRSVFRDNGFEDDSSKINVEEIFKSLAPSTTIKVI